MSKLEWTVELYREYIELHRRNYELDNLWGPNPARCSDDYRRFVELDQFFAQLDNKAMMFSALETAQERCDSLEREVAVLRAGVDWNEF